MKSRKWIVWIACAALLLMCLSLPADGGYYILSVGASNDQALEYYDDRITTYRLSPDVIYLFNFYEVTGEAGE